MEACAAARGQRRRQKGRCVGELIAWLKVGPTLSREQHVSYNPDKIARVLARSEAKQSAHAQAILSCERPKSADSDSEPEGPF
eukprot:4056348-Pyramimonas_sp.AAC.2